MGARAKGCLIISIGEAERGVYHSALNIALVNYFYIFTVLVYGNGGFMSLKPRKPFWICFLSKAFYQFILYLFTAL